MAPLQDKPNLARETHPLKLTDQAKEALIRDTKDSKDCTEGAAKIHCRDRSVCPLNHFKFEKSLGGHKTAIA